MPGKCEDANMMVLTSVAAIGGLTFLLATALIVANRRLQVEEDPRIDAVEEMLPLTNCGACGFPGCRGLAEALVEGRAQPAACTVSDEESRGAIARYLGVAAGTAVKVVARLACAGGHNVAPNRARYTGTRTCLAAAQVAGGPKSCFWGCLGLGDCAMLCDFDAITMDRHDLPVVDEDRCTACGDCVEACPKDLFSLHEAHRRLWVACRNQDRGDQILEQCTVACTACERCAADAPAGLICMRDNLPVVDYARDHQTRQPIERCPTGAIVWMDKERGALRGEASGPILRHSALPDKST